MTLVTSTPSAGNSPARPHVAAGAFYAGAFVDLRDKSATEALRILRDRQRDYRALLHVAQMLIDATERTMKERQA